jgi:hypothetical protein
VVECGGLENRCTARYQGFESLALRQNDLLIKRKIRPLNKEPSTNDQTFNPADVPGQQQLGPQFDTDWQNIDISPLQSIGLPNHHLSQFNYR